MIHQTRFAEAEFAGKKQVTRREKFLARMEVVLPWARLLADEALEDALYDSQALRGFARIELSAEGVPDVTTLLKFRRLLETHDLCKGLFTASIPTSPRRACCCAKAPWWTPR